MSGTVDVAPKRQKSGAVAMAVARARASRSSLPLNQRIALAVRNARIEAVREVQKADRHHLDASDNGDTQSG